MSEGRRNISCCQKQGSNKHRYLRAEHSSNDRDDRSYKHSHGEIETTDEGKVDAGGVWVDVGGQVMRKVNAV